MQKYSRSDDIYNQLVEDNPENWLYGLVSFAVIEEQRIDWAKHFHEHKGRAPTIDEVTEWYEQQPEAVLLRAKGTAENALQEFSSEVVESVLEDERKGIQESIIVSEIKSLNRFWPQFGMNLAAGLVSAVVFAALLVVFAVFVLNDVSPVQLSDELTEKLEFIDNGN
jgi:hypothetical protein